MSHVDYGHTIYDQVYNSSLADNTFKSVECYQWKLKREIISRFSAWIFKEEKFVKENALFM